MASEVWFRNPNLYIRELVEAGEYHMAWDRGFAIKNRVDPHAHGMLYFGRSVPWRVLLIGTQGTTELDADHSMDNPKACYPTWEYGDELELLEDMVENPPGRSEEACTDTSVRIDERPVFGQEHRVVITNIPNTTTAAGRKFMRDLKLIQDQYPNVILHIHALYSYRLTFGMDFRSADFDPRMHASKGSVVLGSGAVERFERVAEHPHWATQFGFKPVDLEIPRNRCIFNIRSAVWAAENFKRPKNFALKRSLGRKKYDLITPAADFEIAEAGVPVLRGAMKTKGPGDKLACDSCSLAHDCKYHREGEVCSLPGSEGNGLRRLFGTGNADDIVTGMGQLLQLNVDRLQMGIEAEQVFDEIDPKTTKLMNEIMKQGAELAKLIDPTKRGVGVSVNVGGGPTFGGPALPGSGPNPKALAAQAIHTLLGMGYTREQITPEVLTAFFASQNEPEAIAGSVVQDDRDEAAS